MINFLCRYCCIFERAAAGCADPFWETLRFINKLWTEAGFTVRIMIDCEPNQIFVVVCFYERFE